MNDDREVTCLRAAHRLIWLGSRCASTAARSRLGASGRMQAMPDDGCALLATTKARVLTVFKAGQIA